MEPPENTNDTGFTYNQVFVRDKYKKTTCIVRKNPDDDPEEGAFGKSGVLRISYQPPVKKYQAISRNNKTGRSRNGTVIRADPISIGNRSGSKPNEKQ